MEAHRNSHQIQVEWVEHLSDRPQIDVSGDIQGTTLENTTVRTWKTQKTFTNVGDKTTRMLDHLESQRFIRALSVHRMQLHLIVWLLHNEIHEQVKRLLDLTICILIAPVVLPIGVITALLIKLDTPGPIFFKQARVGKWGKTFTCYKFRSMFIDAEKRKTELMNMNEADEIVFKIAHDPRVTRVGRLIRKLSIDELPQLYNVLKGDMSWVGPRPAVPIEVANYRYEHLLRLNVTPGITGLQQVSGRSDISFNRWVEFDLQYIRDQSIKEDITILLKTIPVVLTGKGAY